VCAGVVIAAAAAPALYSLIFEGGAKQVYDAATRFETEDDARTVGTFGGQVVGSSVGYGGVSKLSGPRPTPGPKTVLTKAQVTHSSPESFKIVSAEGQIEATYNAATQDLFIDLVLAAKKSQGVGTALYTEALSYATSRIGRVESVSGRMAMDNASALAVSKGDIRATPRAKILDKLGFTEHSYNPSSKVAVSKRPNPGQ
jgi:hypothetical protein